MSKTFTRRRRGNGRLLTRALAAAGAAAAVVAGGLLAAPAATAADCSAGYVALTFDDGPNSGTTNQLINALNQQGATATVFPTGQNVQSNPGGLQAYANAGLQIGNHSWDHPHLTQLSYSQIQQQLSNTQNVIQQAAGVTPQVFRPPYGESNGTVQQVASSLGLTQIIWDVDSQDWNNASSSQIRQAASQLTAGGIILMHDWPQNTINALPGIVQDLNNRNLCTGHISPSTGNAVAPSGGGGDNGGGDDGDGDNGGGDNGDGTCTVTVTPGDSWGDRFNTTFQVSGASDWVVTINTGSGQSVQSSWNASVSGTSGTLTATPDGSGNSFGITLYSNGNSSTPTASCSSAGGSDGGNSGGNDGGDDDGNTGGSCSVSVVAADSWGDRFNTTFQVTGADNWVVTINTGNGQSLQNSWNASVSGTSGTLTATPDGSGNSFGITLYSNGNTATPSATCTTT